MASPILTTVAATGFTVAFFHAAIPTHWLPFVLVARARGWTRQKAIAVLALAGLGHIALMTIVGFVIAWAAFHLDEKLGPYFPWIAGGVLALFGVFYFLRQWTGGGICHHHPPGGQHKADAHCADEHEHSHWEEEMEESPLASPRAGDWTAISGLFVMLTLSPCESFLAIYVAAVRFGWHGFILLSVILACATFTAMALFTWCALVGFEKFRLKFFERYEAGLLGALFIALAVLVVALER